MRRSGLRLALGQPAGGGKSTGKGEARVAAPKAGWGEGGTDICYLLNRLPSLADHMHQGSEDTGVSPNEQGFPHTFVRNKAI